MVFSKLPLEMATRILAHLDLKSLVRCTEVSKGFRGVIMGTESLQYALELGRHGMIQGYEGPGQRQKRLQSYSKSWSTLCPSHHEVIYFDGDPSLESSTGVSEGFLWHAQPESEDVDSGSILELHELRSTRKRMAGIGYRKYQYPFQVKAAAIDVAQTLLVILGLTMPTTMDEAVEARLYFRDLLTNATHSLALQDSYVYLTEWDMTFFAFIDVTKFEISGRMVGLQLQCRYANDWDTLGQADIMLVNWFTGEREGFLTLLDVAFHFLDNETIIIAGPLEAGAPHSLRVQNIDDDEPAVEVSYALPESWVGRNFNTITFFPNISPRPQSTPAMSSLFYPDPDQRLVGLSIIDDVDVDIRHIIIVDEAIFRKRDPNVDSYDWDGWDTGRQVETVDLKDDVWTDYVLNGRRLVASSRVRGNGIIEPRVFVQLTDYNTDAAALNRQDVLPAPRHFHGIGEWRTEVVPLYKTNSPGERPFATAATTQKYADVTRVEATEDNILFIKESERGTQVIVMTFEGTIEGTNHAPSVMSHQE